MNWNKIQTKIENNIKEERRKIKFIPQLKQNKINLNNNENKEINKNENKEIIKINKKDEKKEIYSYESLFQYIQWNSIRRL